MHALHMISGSCVSPMPDILCGHMLTVVYAINSMGYKTPLHFKSTRRTIALAATTFVACGKG